MAQAVLHVPELLEMILLRLPLHDLQCARAVCKLFKSAIDSSISIRRALYLEPGKADDRNPYDPCSWDMNGVPVAVQEACGGSYSIHLYLLDQEQDRYLSMHDLRTHAERSLRDVYIMQPPILSSFTVVEIWYLNLKYPDEFTLEAGETFGSLWAKMDLKPVITELSWDWVNSETAAS
ncbi:hypothetical protein LTR17_014394 [Elasticomyces elasticus]|nr:hypothetical protein LTR17_014394 [Elasticomyces elasticus]